MNQTCLVTMALLAAFNGTTKDCTWQAAHLEVYRGRRKTYLVTVTLLIIDWFNFVKQSSTVVGQPSAMSCVRQTQTYLVTVTLLIGRGKRLITAVGQLSAVIHIQIQISLLSQFWEIKNRFTCAIYHNNKTVMHIKQVLRITRQSDYNYSIQGPQGTQYTHAYIILSLFLFILSDEVVLYFEQHHRSGRASGVPGAVRAISVVWSVRWG